MRNLSPAFKRGALANLLAQKRSAENFKLAKSFEAGAANRSFYKDRSEGKPVVHSLCVNAYSDLGSTIRSQQADAEQGRDLQLPCDRMAGVSARLQ